MHTRAISPLLLTVLTAALVLAGFVQLTPVKAQATHTTVRSTNDFDLVIPASDSCSGEDVHVFGPIEMMVQTTTDPNGGMRVVTHFTPHLTAVGLTTGFEYLPVGPAQFVTNTNGTFPSVTVSVDIIRLLGPGSIDNLVLTLTTHVTINANGDTTVEFADASTACHG